MFFMNYDGMLCHMKICASVTNIKRFIDDYLHKGAFPWSRSVEDDNVAYKRYGASLCFYDIPVPSSGARNDILSFLKKVRHDYNTVKISYELVQKYRLKEYKYIHEDDEEWDDMYEVDYGEDHSVAMDTFMKSSVQSSLKLSTRNVQTHCKCDQDK